jgi:hypothetical protein
MVWSEVFTSMAARRSAVRSIVIKVHSAKTAIAIAVSPVWVIPKTLSMPKILNGFVLATSLGDDWHVVFQ